MQTNFKTTYQTEIKAPTEKVWNALTNAEIVKQYFFGTNLETDWKVGNPIFFKGEFNGTAYTDKGTVLEFIPNEKFVYSYLSSWTGLEDKPENYLQITFEVAQIANGTALTITQSNYDEEKAKHSSANWEMVIDGLKKIVE